MKIYLDNASTTRVYPSVVKEMEKFMSEEYGNPSSAHALGENAKKAMNAAREKIAKEINARPEEIIFTSGGTESDNLAVFGLAKAYPSKKKILVSEIEHPAISEPINFLKANGYKIIKIPVDKSGLILMDYLESELDKDRGEILLVSVMHVNNIFGVVQDIATIGNLCREKGVLFHTDAVQSFGKLKINVVDMKIDLLSASSHKIGGPKGVGLLYVREGVKIFPLVYGGGQEKGLRSGTENVPGIVGFAKALELVRKVDRDKIEKVRDKFIRALGKIEGKINGSLDKRIYNNIHVSFPGVDSGVLVEYLSSRGIYVSSGSACDSKKQKEDYVLKAIGLDDKSSLGSIRISLNEDIKEGDVKEIVSEIERGVKKFRIN